MCLQDSDQVRLNQQVHQKVQVQVNHLVFGIWKLKRDDIIQETKNKGVDMPTR